MSDTNQSAAGDRSYREQAKRYLLGLLLHFSGRQVTTEERIEAESAVDWIVEAILNTAKQEALAAIAAADQAQTAETSQAFQNLNRAVTGEQEQLKQQLQQILMQSRYLNLPAEEDEQT